MTVKVIRGRINLRPRSRIRTLSGFCWLLHYSEVRHLHFLYCSSFWKFDVEFCKVEEMFVGLTPNLFDSLRLWRRSSQNLSRLTPRDELSSSIVRLDHAEDQGFEHGYWDSTLIRNFMQIPVNKDFVLPYIIESGEPFFLGKFRNPAPSRFVKREDII